MYRFQETVLAFQCVCRVAVYFTLYTCAAIPLTTVADNKQYYDTWEFQRSGGYKLVWYYTTKKDFNDNRPNRALVKDKEFVLRSDVRPPTINSVYMLEHSQVNKGEEVLDIGTGSGLHAIYAADKAKHIVATDIYPPAIENAITNAKLHGVEDKIDFRVGDLFEPIQENEKFDVIFININFPFSVGTADRYRLHERFFAEVHKYMKPGARIYYQTSFVKNIPYILELLSRNKFHIVEMHSEYIVEYKHEPLFFMLQSM